ncbi:MAG: hypothetical protein GY716_03835 [bacterium]|nr:hypothetical protein [bacterium]
MFQRQLVLAVLVLVGLFAASCATAQDGDAASQGSTSGAPGLFHDDGKALEQATAAALLAFLREDLVGAERAVAEIETHCLEAGPEDRERLGGELLNYDQAFHVVIDTVRRLCREENLDAAHDQFVWIQRSCLACHKLARTEGKLSGEANGG